MDLLNDLIKLVAPYGAPGLIIAFLLFVILKLYRANDELQEDRLRRADEHRDIAAKNATVLAENTASNVSVANALDRLARNGGR
jgi:hypothetical protein